MASGLLDIVKKTALGAVDANKPMEFVYGTVIKPLPNLEIKITDDLILKQSDGVLILAEGVTNCDTPVHMDWETEL